MFAKIYVMPANAKNAELQCTAMSNFVDERVCQGYILDYILDTRLRSSTNQPKHIASAVF